MKTQAAVCILVWMIYGVVPGVAKAQTANPNDGSLGNLARQVKAEKAKEPKPAKVFTNENIPKAATETIAGESPTAKKPGDEGAPDASAKTGGAHDEKYYRTHLSELQTKLDMHKRELDVLQQKLSQNQVQYYPDPTKTLMQEYTRSDINKLTADIDAKKQQIADDEKAIDDLGNQLRHEGGDPAWLR